MPPLFAALWRLLPSTDRLLRPHSGAPTGRGPPSSPAARPRFSPPLRPFSSSRRGACSHAVVSFTAGLLTALLRLLLHSAIRLSVFVLHLNSIQPLCSWTKAPQNITFSAWHLPRLTYRRSVVFTTLCHATVAFVIARDPLGNGALLDQTGFWDHKSLSSCALEDYPVTCAIMVIGKRGAQ